MLIKGFFYFDLNCWNADQRTFLLQSELLKCQSKGFSTLIRVVEMLIKGFFDLAVEMSIKGLFYFNLNCWNADQRAFLWLELMKCRSKGFSTLIGVAEMSIKGPFYFNLNCWNVNQRAFLLWSKLLKCWSKSFSISIWPVEMSIKGLFYFNLNCCLQKVKIWD